MLEHTRSMSKASMLHFGVATSSAGFVDLWIRVCLRPGWTQQVKTNWAWRSELSCTLRSCAGADLGN